MTLKYAATTEHEGTRYAVLRASSTYEDSPTDVCLIELTAEQVAEWRDRLARADQMRSEHGVVYVAWTDTAPAWRGSECESEPIDADGEIYPPAWGEDERRTELDRVEVDEAGLTFTCFVKNTNERLDAHLYREDIDGLEAALHSHQEGVRT